MPVRKKHVRRIVLALLVVGVLAPVAALVLYGLHVRSGAYARAVEQTLVLRLRRGTRRTELSRFTSRTGRPSPTPTAGT